MKPHTQIYELEFAIKNDDGSTFYHRPELKIKSNGMLEIIKVTDYGIGQKQMILLLKKITKTLLELDNANPQA